MRPTGGACGQAGSGLAEPVNMILRTKLTQRAHEGNSPPEWADRTRLRALQEVHPTLVPGDRKIWDRKMGQILHASRKHLPVSMRKTAFLSVHPQTHSTQGRLRSTVPDPLLPHSPAHNSLARACCGRVGNVGQGNRRTALGGSTGGRPRGDPLHCIHRRPTRSPDAVPSQVAEHFTNCALSVRRANSFQSEGGGVLGIAPLGPLQIVSPI